MDDAANTPISLTSGQGLAPSAASAMMDDDATSATTTDIEMTDLPTEEGTERGVWINADPLPGCVVCNIGESEFFFWKSCWCLRELIRSLMSVLVWEVWTNGLYKSTLHRVVHRGSNYRYVCFYL